MIIVEKNIEIKPSEEKKLVFGIDFEWTKNYKIKNGNIPFCFSIVYFPIYQKSFNVSEKLDIGIKSFYVEKKEETGILIEKAGEFFSHHALKNVIVGHQLHSDIAVISNYSQGKNENIEDFKALWRKRKENRYLFDTRYDVTNYQCKSRRLVDVCKDYRIDVKQPEVKGSMSKMHHVFLQTHDSSIVEKLSVMNIRHSLSTALIYASFYLNNKKTIQTNNILYRNLKEHYKYIASENFKTLVKI